MKKVLFVATVTKHINAFHIPYLKWFKEQGYEVHVASNGEEQIEYCDKHYNFQFERFPLRKNNYKVYKQLKCIINENKYDIIHCHTPVGGVLTRLAAKESRKNGTKVIYTAHGFHFYKGAPLLNWIIYYPIEKLMSKYTDTLITINKEDYKLAEKKFKKIKNVEYVHGVGLDTSRFDIDMTKEELDKIRKKIGIDKNTLVLTYVAELNKNKNQILLIKAMEQLIKENKNKYVLLLIGDGILKEEYDNNIRKNNLEKNIKLLGKRDDIPQILKITDIYVASSLREGMPLNILEAMYMKVPVIATGNRGHKELIKKDFIIKDSNMLVKNIKLIEENKEINDTIIRQNINSLKLYLLNNVREEMKKVYLKMEENMNSKNPVLIIPSCTDYNRGDQALVLQTAQIIREAKKNNNIYMMSTNISESKQCANKGLKIFSAILKHPSRGKNKNNINYGIMLKLQWGFVAIFDFVKSLLLLNKITRFLVKPFLKKETKESLKLYETCDSCFVKGGGFLHNYSKGLTGIYTIYYHLFHIMLAQKLKKDVYIMPNSFGPFKSKFCAKLVNRVIKKCKLCTARESISATGSMNGLGRDIELFPDLGFFIRKNTDNFAYEYLLNKGVNTKEEKCVAITVRPYRFPEDKNPKLRYEEYKKHFVELVDYLYKQEYRILFVVHTRSENKHEDDETCIKEITDMIHDKEKFTVIKDNDLDCCDLKAIYGQCKLVIGTRFHSVIFAISQEIPCIAITYGGNKGNGIFNDMGLSDYAIKIEEFSFESIKEKIKKITEENNDVTEKIKKYINSINKDYNRLIDIIKEGEK